MSAPTNSGAIYECDEGRIRQAHLLAAVVAVLLAGVFLAIAILGPAQQLALNNPDGAMICRIVGFGFAAGVLGLWAFAAWRLSREAGSRVETAPEWISIESAEGKRQLAWREIRSLVRVAHPPIFVMGGLLGWMFYQLLYGGNDMSASLELHDGSQIALPAYVLFYEPMVAEVEQHLAGQKA